MISDFSLAIISLFCLRKEQSKIMLVKNGWLDGIAFLSLPLELIKIFYWNLKSGNLNITPNRRRPHWLQKTIKSQENGERVQKKENNLLVFLPLKEKRFPLKRLTLENWNFNTVFIAYLPIFEDFIVLALDCFLIAIKHRFSKHDYEKKIVFWG